MSSKNILWPLSIVLAFVAGTLVPIPRSSTILAQSTQAQSAKYVEVDYMKTQPGKEADYVRMERETWKAIHQERIKNGQLRSWALYSVRFPAGDDEKYDYITVNAFDRFAQLENPYSDFERMLTKVHPNRKMSDLEQEIGSARRLVRSDIWQLIDETR
jgi:hypothetical protein